MIEVKLQFTSLVEAVAFLSGAPTSNQATVEASAPAAEVKPPKSTKATKATDSAAPAVTASVAAESKPAEAPTPAPEPAPVAPATVEVEYSKTDLPARIAALVAAGRAGEVKPVLAQFGAKKGPELKPEDLAAFSAALKSVEEAEESLG